MKKRTVKQELFYLFSMELLSALIFWVVYSMWAAAEPGGGKVAIVYPLFVLTVILVQGSLYWLNCLRRLKKQKALDEQRIARIYQAFKFIDYGLLGAYILVLLFTKSFSIVGVLIWLFAIIELINYFHYRLSYYTKSGLGLQIIKPLKLLITGTAVKSQIAREILSVQKGK
ncbi:hypothetical protein P7D85_04365 [Enterococcus hulanensis]|uniref:Uncharacterized protein n=1 Tax=Enterococcus hulanensis TaxID=2559929 RepID=A0ABU3EVW7_9ENTE|nr:hypothetical protein [Enterococcus hulanensis]MDT2598995.1 hypothetical protein [Enterococcus hulanensis]MDT2610646.1 hypothetical protein [Enterococcus hulanensis]MDT2614796.1 hypothetical protein [Enterococcus hulanensis]MDT2627234.1 hypothetical protein [Enterococcus hulanensis]MDT2653866.1 hypothetical protein [Enterococcus hulanensis]